MILQFYRCSPCKAGFTEQPPIKQPMSAHRPRHDRASESLLWHMRRLSLTAAGCWTCAPPPSRWAAHTCCAGRPPWSACACGATSSPSRRAPPSTRSCGSSSRSFRCRRHPHAMPIGIIDHYTSPLSAFRDLPARAHVVAFQKGIRRDYELSYTVIRSSVPISQRHGQSCVCPWQASIQRVELDLRWDAKEFPAALDRSSHLKPLPAGVEVWLNGNVPKQVGALPFSAMLLASVRGTWPHGPYSRPAVMLHCDPS